MKHNCIFEITQPNIHSELYKATFVKDFTDYESTNEFCKSMNNFKPKDIFLQFILRCLEQKEYDVVQNFLKTNQKKDITEIYSPFIQKIKL